MQLEEAQPDDVPAFVALLEAAARWQVSRGVDQWLPGSFAAQRPLLRAAQNAGHLLVIRGRAGLRAGVVLGDRDHGGVWDSSALPMAYLSKLVVSDADRGRGLGRVMLAECERLAERRGAEYLRLDCVATNQRLIRYYQAAGYYPRGAVAAFGTTVLRHDRRLSSVANVPVGRLSDVDDRRWGEVQWATLLFVVRGDQVLLIHKKRGHGQGKINGPGGKVERGETPLACAVRETREEVGLSVADVRPVANLKFHDTDGSRMLGFVYTAALGDREPVETIEAKPFWCQIDALPFDDMWDDDRVWLPRALTGDCVSGEFLMHDDRLVNHCLHDVDVQALIKKGSEVKT